MHLALWYGELYPFLVERIPQPEKNLPLEQHQPAQFGGDAEPAKLCSDALRQPIAPRPGRRSETP